MRNHRRQHSIFGAKHESFSRKTPQRRIGNFGRRANSPALHAPRSGWRVKCDKGKGAVTLRRTRSITHPVVLRGWLLERRIIRYECCYFFARTYNTPTVCYYDDDNGGQNIDVYLHFAQSVPVTSRAKHVRPSTAALFERTRLLSTVTARCILHTIQTREARQHCPDEHGRCPPPSSPAILVFMYTHLRRARKCSRPDRIIHVCGAFDEKRYPAAILPYRTSLVDRDDTSMRETSLRVLLCKSRIIAQIRHLSCETGADGGVWGEKTVVCAFKFVRKENPKPVARHVGRRQRH